ncbi:MAG: hypothetical protein ACJAS9_003823 [Polaribacter sp.]|jgi:hypothetical protein
MVIYQQVSEYLEECFHFMESHLPSPDIVEISEQKCLRYTEKLIETAIIQKLARYLSSLNAARLLLDQGYTQEVGVMFRTLDEIGEDIRFLCIPKTGGDFTEIHRKYLEYFYQEEFDNPDNAFLSTQNRPTIPRKKIHAAIANIGKKTLNPSDNQKNHRTISQAYSGYVHGSSEHLIEMVGGNPLRYFLRGMAGTKRQQEFAYNYWDYAYRGILAVMITSKALGFGELYEQCLKFRKDFEKQTGDTGSGDPVKQMRKMKNA